MNVTLCDRCKKEFKKEPLSFFGAIQPGKVFKQKFINSSPFNRETEYFDLCNECWEDFKKWMSKG